MYCRKKIRINDEELIEALRNETLRYTFNGGVVTPIVNDLYLNNDPEERINFRFFEKPLAVLPVAIYFRKHSYLVEAFNEKLYAFKSSGLIDYWVNLFFQQNNVKDSDSPAGPEQLTVEALLGAFQLMIFGWAIGLIAFIIELLYFKRKCLPL